MHEESEGGGSEIHIGPASPVILQGESEAYERLAPGEGASDRAFPFQGSWRGGLANTFVWKGDGASSSKRVNMPVHSLIARWAKAREARGRGTS